MLQNNDVDLTPEQNAILEKKLTALAAKAELSKMPMQQFTDLSVQALELFIEHIDKGLDAFKSAKKKKKLTKA